jgi:hypothetical protein
LAFIFQVNNLTAWMATVQRMSSKKSAGHLTDEDIKAIAGFLTAKGAEKALY